MRFRLVLLTVLLTLGLAATARAGDIAVTGSQQLDPRLIELTLQTQALDFPVKVRVLLPDGYAANPDWRYPVLYLLHGSFDDAASWTAKGDAEKITAGQPLIVVMPAAAGKGNAGGWASDWRNEGRGGPPKWETFTIGQLIAWVDARYRTVAARGGRAIAGLSMGGFSAMSYAVRHPDLFAAASSYSGAVDTNYPGVWPVIELETSADGGSTPEAIWGPRTTDEISWRAHNPWDLAGNLSAMTLSVRTGNGQRGPSDSPGFPDPIEVGVHDMSVSLHQRLDALHVPHVFDDYGPGTHSWPYWQRDLRLDLPRIMATFANPPAAPSPFTYTSAEPRFDVYGWSVAIQRAATAEFATLADADASGFTLRGSGSGSGSGAATVTTASLFDPGAVYAVSVGGARRTARADGDGRLRVDVPPGTTSTRVTVTPIGAPAGTRSTTSGCGNTARFRVTLPRGLRTRVIDVRWHGRSIATVRGVHRSVRVDLRGRPAGTYHVTIVVRAQRHGGGSVRKVLRRGFRVCA